MRRITRRRHVTLLSGLLTFVDQIMIMFVIAASIALGTILALSLTYRKVTSPYHQIEWKNLRARENENWK